MAGSRAPAGSLGRSRQAGGAVSAGSRERRRGGVSAGANPSRGESARFCTNACESAHGGRAQAGRTGRAHPHGRVRGVLCWGVCLFHCSRFRCYRIRKQSNNRSRTRNNRIRTRNTEPARNETIAGESAQHRTHRRLTGGAMVERRTLQKLLQALGEAQKNEVGFSVTSVFWRHRNYASVSVGTLWGHYRNSIGSRRGIDITETEKPPPRRARAPVGGSLCC